MQGDFSIEQDSLLKMDAHVNSILNVYSYKYKWGNYIV